MSKRDRPEAPRLSAPEPQKFAAPISPWLTREKAAEYLGCTKASLESHAVSGTGPRYYCPPGTKLVRYRVEDLDAWMGARVAGAKERAARDRELAVA